MELVALHAGMEVQSQGCIGQQKAAVGSGDTDKGQGALCVHWAVAAWVGLGCCSYDSVDCLFLVPKHHFHEH